MFTNNILENIYILPQELKDEIWKYVDVKEKIFVKKKYYILYHYLLEIPKHRYLNYICMILRNDCAFILNQIITENNKKWSKLHKITYGDVSYSSYLMFAMSKSIDYSANNCRNVLENCKDGLSKKRHKKNRYKNIKWTN